jgi:predicted metal-dependent hydrolase
MTSLRTYDALCTGERWQQAIKLFNDKQWYEAHDAFEDLWHEAIGETRLILQGIIQVAVAEHHLCNGNLRGSILLMAEGLNRLRTPASLDIGLDLETFRKVVELRLGALQSGQRTAELPQPFLAHKAPDEV